MAHPSSYYIKLLLTQTWGENNEDEEESETSINATLASYDLPPLLEYEYTNMQLALRPPAGFAYANKKSRISNKFMKQEGIFTLWRPNKEDKRVLSFLLGQQRARIKIDIMLMGGVPKEVIAKMVNKEFNYREPVTRGMIATYQHFFWNTDLPSAREWLLYLAGNPHRDALMAAYYDGPDQALYRVGGNPIIGDPKKPLREANRQTYFTLTSLRYKPDTSENIGIRSRLTADLRSLHDSIHGEGADHAEMLKRFRNFLVQKAPTTVETFDNMLGPTGSHSGDGKEDKEGDDE